MSTTSLILLVVFIAIFIQIWFVVFLYKTHIGMLKKKWETTYISKKMELSEVMYRTMLLDEYKEAVQKFMRRIHNISVMVNVTVTSTILYLIVR